MHEMRRRVMIVSPYAVACTVMIECPCSRRNILRLHTMVMITYGWPWHGPRKAVRSADAVSNTHSFDQRLRVRPGASPTNDSDRNAIRFGAFFSSFGGGLRSVSGYPGPRIHTMEATKAGIPRVS